MNRWSCMAAALIMAAGLSPAQENKLALAIAPAVVPNIELTVYLVSGLAQPQGDGRDDVPRDLAETLQQLRGVFAYKSYKLVEAVSLRGRAGRGTGASGQLPDFSQYSFRYERARISTEAPRIIHLDGLLLQITKRHSERIDVLASVQTDLDVREGQKTVVGKSAVNATDVFSLSSCQKWSTKLSHSP